MLLCVAMASVYMFIVTSGEQEQRRCGDNNVKCPVCNVSLDHVTSVMRSLDDHTSSAPPVTLTKLQLVCLICMAHMFLLEYLWSCI